MRKLLSIIFLLPAFQVPAQTLLEDSVKTPAAASILIDTLQPISFLPSDLEYIPAEETPELLADRLLCLQKTIPLEFNEKVSAFINYFTVRDREYTRMVLRRRNNYFPLFEKYLAQYNLPEELKYLSIIESGLNPKAVSRARAVGLWQFMSGTGRYLGLRSNWYIDERMDPEKSTDAACRYLTMLYSMFHDWPLALAAYNSGPGTVYRAIRRSGYKKTFWEIYPHLPKETRAYVPQFVAIIYAVNYADEHNLVEPSQDGFPTSDTLVVRKFFYFDTFAHLTGTCVEDLQKLNPSIQRNAVPEGTSFVLRIPNAAKQKLNENRLTILDSASKAGRQEIEMLARNSTGSTYGREAISYTVRSGDGLGIIAYSFNVSMEDIKKWNNLNSNLIHPGKQLTIWIKPKTTSTPFQASSPLATSDGMMYTVQPGDTLWDISRKFQGLTIEKIKTLNNLKSNKLKPGQKLIIG
jgi:membrane-bound lytic murein transglycosylase D